MDSQLTGSNELLYVQTEKVSVTIKGKATHPNFQGIEHKNGDSSIKVHSNDFKGWRCTTVFLKKWGNFNGYIFNLSDVL